MRRRTSTRGGGARSDAGTTVAEFAVSMGLFTIVLVIASTVLVTMQNAVSRADSRTRTNDQLRLAVASIDRQVRSGNVIHDPATEPGMPSGMSLRVYTQANAPTSVSANRCVQWRVSGGELQTREWVDNWSQTIPQGIVTGWRTVATGVQNEQQSPEVQAFRFDTGQAAFGGRIIEVNFVVNNDARKGRYQGVQASITGRNVQYGHPASFCADVPPA